MCIYIYIYTYVCVCVCVCVCVYIYMCIYQYHCVGLTHSLILKPSAISQFYRPTSLKNFGKLIAQFHTILTMANHTWNCLLYGFSSNLLVHKDPPFH